MRAGSRLKGSSLASYMELSVLMALHRGDSPGLFDGAMGSVSLQQSRKPDQIVLVIDGPIGYDLDSVVRRWEARLGTVLHVVRLETNVGLGGALNRGLRACRGDLVARMDADDLSCPQRFELQIREFQRNGKLAVLGSTATSIDTHGKEIGPMVVPLTNEAVYRWIWACPFIHPSVTFRRQMILDIGNYNSRLATRQDYDLWFRCAEAGYVMQNLDFPLIKYRVSANTKNRSWGVVWKQVWIGLRGCKRLRAPLRHWVAVVSPVCMFLLPEQAARLLRKRVKFRG